MHSSLTVFFLFHFPLGPSLGIFFVFSSKGVTQFSPVPMSRQRAETSIVLVVVDVGHKLRCKRFISEWWWWRRAEVKICSFLFFTSVTPSLCSLCRILYCFPTWPLFRRNLPGCLAFLQCLPLFHTGQIFVLHGFQVCNGILGGTGFVNCNRLWNFPASRFPFRYSSCCFFLRHIYVEGNPSTGKGIFSTGSFLATK